MAESPNQLAPPTSPPVLCASCGYDLADIPLEPATQVPMKRCPECGLKQAKPRAREFDRTVAAVAGAAWVPWGWALVMAVVVGTLDYLGVPPTAAGAFLLLLAVGGYVALLVRLAFRAMRVVLRDALPGSAFADVFFALVILLVGHMCAALVAAVAFGFIMVGFAIVGGWLGLVP